MKLPQLSLRDLFWLVLVVAMGLGLWVDRSSLVASREKFLNTTVDFSKREIEWQHATGAESPADFYSRRSRP